MQKRPLGRRVFGACAALALGCGGPVELTGSVDANLSAGDASAFQANTGDLWMAGPGGAHSMRLGMKSGTSPSLASLSTGGIETAFQANTGRLWTVGSAGNRDWGLGMRAGTSPSITALTGGGYEVAFQANTGSLWTVGTAGNRNWGLAMMAGTSPSIAATSGGGYEVAFQANTSSLWTVGPGGDRNWGLGMRAGTSPSLTGLSKGGYEVAFQANTGDLWTVGTAGNRNWGLAMMAGTSPSITDLPNGEFEVAFQANTSSLWTTGSAGVRDYRLGMERGTSPSISSDSSGAVKVLFQANTGSLWTTGRDGTRSLGLGMKADTSPSSGSVRGKPTSVGGGPVPGAAALPAKMVGGYWQNWGAPNIALRDVPSEFNVVYLAFALGYDSSSGAVHWEQYVQSDSSFISDIKLLHSQGRKVILSIGGWFDLPNGGWGFRLGPDNAMARVRQFVESIKTLHSKYGFDGIDWDLEHGIDVGGLQSASKALKAAFGPDFAITAAAPVYDADYVTLAVQLDNDFDLIGPQYYNLGLSESDSRAKVISNTRALISAGIPASKIGIGVENVNSNGNLNDDLNTLNIGMVNSAWAELSQSYPTLRGAYVWSINLDQGVGYAFAKQVGPNIRN